MGVKSAGGVNGYGQSTKLEETGMGQGRQPEAGNKGPEEEKEEEEKAQKENRLWQPGEIRPHA